MECIQEKFEKYCNCTYEPCDKKIDAVNVSITTDVWENFQDAFSPRSSKGHIIAP